MKTNRRETYFVTITAVLPLAHSDPSHWPVAKLFDELKECSGVCIDKITAVRLGPPGETAAPLFNAAPPTPKKTVKLGEIKRVGAYISKRKKRARAKARNGEELPQLEYLYISSGYILIAKKQGVGTHTINQRKKCVWLTKKELEPLYMQLQKRRAECQAIRAEAAEVEESAQ